MVELNRAQLFSAFIGYRYGAHISRSSLYAPALVYVCFQMPRGRALGAAVVRGIFPVSRETTTLLRVATA